jgi:hypothetical protein
MHHRSGGGDNLLKVLPPLASIRNQLPRVNAQVNIVEARAGRWVTSLLTPPRYAELVLVVSCSGSLNVGKLLEALYVRLHFCSGKKRHFASPAQPSGLSIPCSSFGM